MTVTSLKVVIAGIIRKFSVIDKKKMSNREATVQFTVTATTQTCCSCSTDRFFVVCMARHESMIWPQRALDMEL